MLQPRNFYAILSILLLSATITASSIRVHSCGKQSINSETYEVNKRTALRIELQEESLTGLESQELTIFVQAETDIPANLRMYTYRSKEEKVELYNNMIQPGWVGVFSISA